MIASHALSSQSSSGGHNNNDFFLSACNSCVSSPSVCWSRPYVARAARAWRRGYLIHRRPTSTIEWTCTSTGWIWKCRSRTNSSTPYTIRRPATWRVTTRWATNTAASRARTCWSRRTAAPGWSSTRPTTNTGSRPGLRKSDRHISRRRSNRTGRRPKHISRHSNRTGRHSNRISHQRITPNPRRSVRPNTSRSSCQLPLPLLPCRRHRRRLPSTCRRRQFTPAKNSTGTCRKHRTYRRADCFYWSRRVSRIRFTIIIGTVFRCHSSTSIWRMTYRHLLLQIARRFYSFLLYLDCFVCI